MSNDIDTKIQGKQAEYETVSRAVAALLEQHDKLRAEFDIEIKAKNDKITAELDKKLKNKRSELDKLEKDIVRRNDILEKVANDTLIKQKELDEQDIRLKREKDVIERVVSDLNVKKLSLEAEMSVLKAENSQLITDIDKNRTELLRINDKIIVMNEEVNTIGFRIDDLKVNHDFKQAEYNKEEELAKGRISQINSQLDTASRSLHEVKLEENNIRQDLADWSLKLEGRESTINAREAKVTQQEKRVFSYSKFTGL